jgi:hypothetical protein
VANDAAPAVDASWRDRMDGAFEAVENMLSTAHNHFKRFVIVISANFTLSHG